MRRRRVAAVVEEGCVLMAILFGYELEGDDGKDTLLQMSLLTPVFYIEELSNDPIIIIRLHSSSIDAAPNQGYHR